MEKPNILICNQFFYPGFKAGGPIQSLVQLIGALQSKYQFYVLTSAYDLNQTQPYTNILTETFTPVTLHNGAAVKVYYTSGKLSAHQFKTIIQHIQPQIVYVNGLYDFNFCLLPFSKHRWLQQQQIRLVVSPRGMLQAGALQQKRVKKQAFLFCIKTMGWLQNCSWHATDVQEKNDIQQHFSVPTKNIFIATNVAKIPVPNILYTTKITGTLQLVYLSIITPKKNLLLVLQALANCTKNISLHIYGAIKEAAYWKQCQQCIEGLPNNISIVYKGTVEPALVQQTLQEYHALVLLTQGENFGHALFEALSVGRPVITSQFTPWQQLQQQQAGNNVDISMPIQSIATEIDTWANFNQQQINAYYNGAYQLATNYYNQQHYLQQYQPLFATN